MCGICGFFGKKKNKREIVEKMKEKLVHRGPDAQGSFVNDSVALGFRRLSIIDLEGGLQPMKSSSQNLTVVFNGEIYNYQELREQMEREKKILFAGYKDWKCNDMYPNDFTKRYHAVSYAFDEDALYLSVGLLNTSYREEYCLWVNSENVVVGTWRPNVTYLPAEEDMTWKFTGTFEPSCIL